MENVQDLIEYLKHLKHLNRDKIEIDIILKNLTEIQGKQLSIQNVRNCSKCGNPHLLRDEDAGTEREIQRLCINCCW